MDHESLDPYEQQLFAVFNTHDLHHTGSLDHDGLAQLCTTLQLEEHGSDLIHCLLTKSKTKRVTFYEFKDALLALLSEKSVGDSNLIEAKSDSGGESSDREISPKYVYGAKKYGRRTRPRSDNFEDTLENGDTKISSLSTNTCMKQNKVQRSSSQSDVHPSKKRKSNSKLKRCTSFPDATNYVSEWTDYNSRVFSPIAASPERQCDIEEKMMQEIWEQLDVGKNGYLNKDEMVIVCEYIGMNRIPEEVIKQLYDKFTVENNKKISFSSFVDFFRNSRLSLEQRKHVNESCLADDQNTFQKSNFLQCITLGPDGSGIINSDALIEMWEGAGIVGASDLLNDLGFSKKEIIVSELALVLEEELHNLTDQQDGVNQSITFSTTPHVALLQASLALYQSELRCLKSVMEHMNAERDKLKNDIVDANQRASLLAQEVDDNHAKMEKTTKDQVRHLEQRHADIVRELTEQLAGEREQACLLNSKLEKRVATLEAEEMRLKIELVAAQHDFAALEKENHNLLEQVATLEKTNAHLVENVNVLENEKQKMCDIEGNREREKMRSYLEKISALQLENTTLRDRNDELSIELENISAQLSSIKLKKSNSIVNTSLSGDIIDENISVDSDSLHVGAAVKRRGQSSVKTNMTYSPEKEESPRTGKFRCYDSNQTLSKGINIMPYKTNESGVDYDYVDSSVSITSYESGSEEIPLLYARIAHLEKLLTQYGYDISTDTLLSKSGEEKVENDENNLLERCHYLEKLLTDVKIALTDQTPENSCLEECGLKKHIISIKEKISENNFLENKTNSVCINASATLIGNQTEAGELCTLDTYKNLIKINKDIEDRCSELENSLELLKEEYEQCEDYWANKLDEERQLFDQEQKQSNSNFLELLTKMTELEEQFASQDNKLPIIDENSLEKQFTDLEEDFESYKWKAESDLEKQKLEILSLKNTIASLQQKKEQIDVEVQSDTNVAHDKSTLTDFEQCNDSFQLNTTEVNSSQHNSLDNHTSWNTQSKDIFSPDPKLSTKNSELNSSFCFHAKNHSSDSLVHPTKYSSQPVLRTRKHCTSSSEISYKKDEIKRLRTMKHHLDEECRTLSKQKEGLLKEVNELQNTIREEEEPYIHFKWKGLRPFPIAGGSKQTYRINIGTLQDLYTRLQQLDQRCRHLQQILRKQQQQAERMLHQSWLLHKNEVSDLQIMLKDRDEKYDQQTVLCNDHLERLAQADLLVKDLYIENSYLIATVQRYCLERHCHIHAYSM